MFDHSKLTDVLAAYKQNLVSKQWGDEKYKWEAVKWFQDNWDVDTIDPAQFAGLPFGFNGTTIPAVCLSVCAS